MDAKRRLGRRICDAAYRQLLRDAKAVGFDAADRTAGQPREEVGPGSGGQHRLHQGCGVSRGLRNASQTPAAWPQAATNSGLKIARSMRAFGYVDRVRRSFAVKGREGGH